MALKRNVGKLPAGGRIEEAESSLPVPDEDLVLSGVIANVIRIAGELCGGEQLEGSAVKDPKGAITPVCDKEFVFPRHENNSLRFFEPGDSSCPFIGAKVENLNCVVPERRYKKTLALDINTHMVDAPFHVR